jgi:hypothetical protein
MRAAPPLFAHCSEPLHPRWDPPRAPPPPPRRRRRCPTDLLSSQTERGLAIKAELSTVEDLHKDDAAPPPRRARTRPGAETKP